MIREGNLYIALSKSLSLEFRSGALKSAILALMISIAAALPDVARGREPARDNRSPGTPKRAAELTVDVLSFDKRNAIEPRPVAKAFVGIEGGEAPLETNEKGRVRLSVATKKPTLLIVVDGDRCEVPNLPITSAQQTITVLVDLSDKPKLQCQLK